MSEFNPDIFEQSKEREKAFLRFAQKFGFLNDGWALAYVLKDIGGSTNL